VEAESLHLSMTDTRRPGGRGQPFAPDGAARSGTRARKAGQFHGRVTAVTRRYAHYHDDVRSMEHEVFRPVRPLDEPPDDSHRARTAYDGRRDALVEPPSPIHNEGSTRMARPGLSSASTERHLLGLPSVPHHQPGAEGGHLVTRLPVLVPLLGLLDEIRDVTGADGPASRRVRPVAHASELDTPVIRPIAIPSPVRSQGPLPVRRQGCGEETFLKMPTGNSTTSTDIVGGAHVPGDSDPSPPRSTGTFWGRLSASTPQWVLALNGLANQLRHNAGDGEIDRPERPICLHDPEQSALDVPFPRAARPPHGDHPIKCVTRHPHGTTLPPRAWDHLVPHRAGRP